VVLTKKKENAEKNWGQEKRPEQKILGTLSTTNKLKKGERTSISLDVKKGEILLRCLNEKASGLPVKGGILEI